MMLLKSTLTIFLPILLTLTACSNSPEPSAEMEKITNQQQEIESLKTQQVALQTQLQVWQEMQPNVERLVAIESELTLLITQLNTIVDESKNNKAKQKVITPVKKSISPEHFYTIQLASINDVKQLSKLWDDLYIKNTQQLMNLSPMVEEVTVNNKTYYRLKAGKFNTKRDANLTCEQLKKVAVSCIISNNIGRPF